MKKILLSIKPNYVENILAGRKLVEYRKRRPKDENVRQVLIYASYPVKKVVAEFTLKGYLYGTPQWLWEHTSQIGGITKEEFDHYYENSEVAYAYLISNLHILVPSRKLKEYGMEYGPQDYCYVEE